MVSYLVLPQGKTARKRPIIIKVEATYLTRFNIMDNIPVNLIPTNWALRSTDLEALSFYKRR